MKYLASFCLFIAFISLAWSAKENNNKTVSPQLYRQLKAADGLIEQKKYSEAQQILNKALQVSHKESYEQASVLRALSSVYALQSKYQQAADYLAKCLALKALPDEQQQQAMLNLGQLYMALEKYALAIDSLQPWLENHASDLDALVMLSQAHTQLKRYRQALPYIKKAIALSKKPKESWYQLNLALYYELKNYRAAVDILQQLIRRYADNKNYWEQLSAVYQELQDYKKAASIKQLAYQKGLMRTEKDILSLANLYIYIGSPYKAAILLEQSISKKILTSTRKNWETQASAWEQAKEFDKAVRALETAVKLEAKGQLLQRLGYIYVEQEQWQKAAAVLVKALAQGNLKNTGNTYLLLGICYVELNQLKQANSAFISAAKFSKQKKSAQEWLNFINESS